MWLSKQKIQVGPQVEFSGLDLGRQGCTLTYTKYNALQNCQPPKNLHNLHGFMGLVNWLTIQQPDVCNSTPRIRELIRTKVKYIWTQEHQAEFKAIKIILDSPLFLKPQICQR